MARIVIAVFAAFVVMAAFACSGPISEPIASTDSSADDIDARIEATIVAIQAQATIDALVAAEPATPTPTPDVPVTPVSPSPTPPAATPTPSATSIPSPTPLPQPTAIPSLADVVERVGESVVRIVTDTGTGSGFVIESSGYILTNAHVVGRNEEVTVVFNGRFEFPGIVIGMDEELDLAVVKVEIANPLQTLELINSDTVRPGEEVIVLGFPLGLALGAELSVTRGIVSSKRTFGINEYLQTDAAVNPGNSGGPVINAAGQVVGVTSARITGDPDEAIQGVGLAITANQVLEVLPILKAGGMVLIADLDQTADDFVDTSEWVGYTNETGGYAISLPGSWTIDDADPFGVVMFSADDLLLFEIFPVDTYTIDSDEVADDVVALRTGSYGEAVELGRSEITTATGVVGELIILEFEGTVDYCQFTLLEYLVIDDPYTYDVVATVCSEDLIGQTDLIGELLDSFALLSPITGDVGNTYTNPRHDYSILLAEGWTVDDSDPDAVFVEFDTEPADIYLWTIIDSSGQTLDQFVDGTIGFRNLESHAGIVITSESDVDWIPGVEGTVIHYTEQGAPGFCDTTSTEVLLRKGTAYFEFLSSTCSRLVDQYEDALAAAFASIRFR